MPRVLNYFAPESLVEIPDEWGSAVFRKDRKRPAS
jgi:hypothetical protein